MMVFSFRTKGGPGAGSLLNDRDAQFISSFLEDHQKRRAEAPELFPAFVALQMMVPRAIWLALFSL
jgi:hypothetical protein